MVGLVIGLALLVYAGLRSMPSGLIALALIVLAGLAAWQGLLRTGRARVVSLIVAGILVAGALAAHTCPRGAVRRPRRHRRPARLGPPPDACSVRTSSCPCTGPEERGRHLESEVGWCAVTHHLAEQARKRGIEPIELKPGDDLVALVQAAVARGADGLMAAGGDGTQALVATIAAEHDLPFACIPAGTRNHFALDLGVDRDDVVGALDAFVNGGEKRVDLGQVEGRTFVNNVSLGLYAEAVQHEGYRDAKVRTLLDTVPTLLGTNGPVEQQEHAGWRRRTRNDRRPSPRVNNVPTRSGHGLGTRPRMDEGVPA
jgi:hypothetical protein